MINIRHTGIYVNDIDKMANFYIRSFDMIAICRNEPDKNPLLDDLFKSINIEIMTTKLITTYGKEKGQGDMIELVKVLSPIEKRLQNLEWFPVYKTGTAHIAIGVGDMEQTVIRIIENDGKQMTQVHKMKNGNLCCFCMDCEGNWIELIGKKS